MLILCFLKKKKNGFSCNVPWNVFGSVIKKSIAFIFFKLRLACNLFQLFPSIPLNMVRYISFNVLNKCNRIIDYLWCYKYVILLKYILLIYSIKNIYIFCSVIHSSHSETFIYMHTGSHNYLRNWLKFYKCSSSSSKNDTTCWLSSRLPRKPNMNVLRFFVFV